MLYPRFHGNHKLRKEEVMEKEINVEVKIENIDEQIDKAERLVQLLKEAKSLADELAHIDLKVNI